MKNFFGIENEDFLNNNYFKVINGIAGSAKSTNCDTILNEFLIEYGRYTSTNRAKRDAIARFGGHVDTIAGGLFNTFDGVFYSSEKEVPYDTVVIDEVLQSDPRVFDWIEHHVGKVNIIVCTDSKQMLTPSVGDVMIARFEKLISKKNCIYVNLSKSFRPRTEKTERYFTECFNADSDGFDLFEEFRKTHEPKSIYDISFNVDDIFITHTNECERFIYTVWNLYNRTDAELIPKGVIAREDKADASKYPIVPQSDVKRGVNAYLQIGTVGSPTRYQGSEVKIGRKLYYIYQVGAKVSNREWYTVATRCWDIDSIELIEVVLTKTERLTSFNGIPVLKKTIPQIEKNDEIDKLIGDRTMITDDESGTLTGYTNCRPGEYNIPGEFYYNGKRISVEHKIPKTHKMSCASLLKKDPDLSYGNYMPEFYRAYEKAQKRAELDNITEVILAPSGKSDKPKSEYEYGIDFFGSYPTILNIEKMPTSGFFFTGDDHGIFHTCVPECEEYVDFYVSSGNSSSIHDGSIVTGELVRWMQEEVGGTFFYIGSATAKRGTRIGMTVSEKYHTNKETKSDLKKTMHWGYIGRPYLQAVAYENMKPTGYVVNETQDKQLLMTTIKSMQMLNILKLRYMIYGDLIQGAVVADCLYFDTDDVNDIFNRACELLPGYEFRIFKNNEEKTVICKNYEELKSRDEIAKEKRSLRRKACKKV